MAAAPIVREIRGLLPEFDLLLSVITPAGDEMARKQIGASVDGIFYFPIDMPWVARHVVSEIRASVFVTLESELWPNVLHEVKRRNAATAMVNGRISDRSYRRIQRFAQGTFGWILGNMDRLLMQSQRDADRVSSLLGGNARADRVAVVGNSKFDQEIARLSPEQSDALRRSLRLPDGAAVLIAGSTRSAAEDSEVLGAYLALREQAPDLCLIVAPRHIERSDEVAGAMMAAGLQPTRKTRLGDASGPVRHLVLDTYGELADLYAIATIVYIGNTFPPVVQGGGQNLIQPLAHGKPVIVGPYTASCRAEVALALEAGVCFQVSSRNEFVREAGRLLTDVDARSRIERRALALVDENRGVSRRYAEAVAELAHAASRSIA